MRVFDRDLVVVLIRVEGSLDQPLVGSSLVSRGAPRARLARFTPCLTCRSSLPLCSEREIPTEALAADYAHLAEVTRANPHVSYYVRYEHGEEIRYGVLSGDTIQELSAHYFADPTATGRTVSLHDVRLLAPLDPKLPRYAAVAAYLHEKDGARSRAANLYAEAARRATNVPERDHLTREAARVRQAPDGP
jgi:hypothetical protein